MITPPPPPLPNSTYKFTNFELNTSQLLVLELSRAELNITEQ